jgi:hypothetical protein
MRKFFCFLIIVFTFYFLFFNFVQAQSWWPLVPCGRTGQVSCTRCDLFRLADNVIHFFLEGIVPPVAAVLFIAAGLMIVLAGANPGLYAKGIAIFKNTFIGLVIILASWLIVNTLIQSFGPIQAQDSWFRFTCPADGAITPGGPLPPGAPPATTQQSAQALINAIGTGSFSTNGDCGGNYNARQNIQDMADGKFPAVCSTSCSCVTGGSSGNVTVDSSILITLADLRIQRGMRFTVTSLTTGQHSSNGSFHYKGRAADIVISSPISQSVLFEARGFLQSRGGSAWCESSSGAKVSDCNLSQTDHIHWEK